MVEKKEQFVLFQGIKTFVRNIILAALLVFLCIFVIGELGDLIGYAGVKKLYKDLQKEKKIIRHDSSGQFADEIDENSLAYLRDIVLIPYPKMRWRKYPDIKLPITDEQIEKWSLPEDIEALFYKAARCTFSQIEEVSFADLKKNIFQIKWWFSRYCFEALWDYQQGNYESMLKKLKCVNILSDDLKNSLQQNAIMHIIGDMGSIYANTVIREILKHGQLDRELTFELLEISRKYDQILKKN